MSQSTNPLAVQSTTPNDQAPPTAPPPVPRAPDAVPRPVEIGGREGPEPTRYGDWEKSGRCIDF